MKADAPDTQLTVFGPENISVISDTITVSFCTLYVTTSKSVEMKSKDFLTFYGDDRYQINKNQISK